MAANVDCGSSPPDQFAGRTPGGRRLVHPVQRRQRQPECLAPHRRHQRQLEHGRIFIDGVLRRHRQRHRGPDHQFRRVQHRRRRGCSWTSTSPGFWTKCGLAPPPDTAAISRRNPLALRPTPIRCAVPPGRRNRPDPCRRLGKQPEWFPGHVGSTASIDPTWSTDVPFIGGPPPVTAPTITTQPTNQTVTPDRTPSFTVRRHRHTDADLPMAGLRRRRHIYEPDQQRPLQRRHDGDADHYGGHRRTLGQSISRDRDQRRGPRDVVCRATLTVNVRADHHDTAHQSDDCRGTERVVHRDGHRHAHADAAVAGLDQWRHDLHQSGEWRAVQRRHHECAHADRL